MSKLTIEQIRERKVELERQFAELLTEFEEQSGVLVVRIEYFRSGSLVPAGFGGMEVTPIFENSVTINVEMEL